MEGWAGFRLALKLKHLKGKIKEWAAMHFGDVRAIEEGTLEEIQLLDREDERCPLSAADCNRRLAMKDEFMKKLRRRSSGSRGPGASG